ncbi:hypothetical protein B5X24_HaOG211849 [Helicoverpa armigera]|nr:hypothetical protein B5X24_HaOG211849 [Helicoverpa armigera]
MTTGIASQHPALELRVVSGSPKARRSTGSRRTLRGRRTTRGLPPVAAGPRLKRPTGDRLKRVAGAPKDNGGAAQQSSSEEDAAAVGSDQERRANFAKTVAAAFRDVSLKRLKANRRRAIVSASACIIAAAEVSFGQAPKSDLVKLQEEVAHGRPGVAPEGEQKSPGRIEKNEREMAAFQARFSVLEGRVLGPPSRRRSPQRSKGPLISGTPTQKGTAEQAPCRGTERAAQPNPKAATAVRAQRTPSAPVAAKRLPKPTPSAAPTSPATESEWQVVGEKKKRRRAAKAAKKKAQRRRRRERAAAAQLCAPKTAAVVLTQQPDTVKRVVSYRDVLAKAKEVVSLAELSITEGLRLRVTATGARMVEVPGAVSGPAADALAERLRATINADGSRVSRPYKWADLRILGLDDSVTAEMVAAVARTGGCSADEVKAGTIRPDFRGMRTITVRCPVAAAKTIVDGRRLLVGWVSTQVKLLDPRPLSPVTRPWNAAPRRTALHVRLLASRPNTERGAARHPPSLRVGLPPSSPPPPSQWPPPQLLRPPPPPMLPPLSAPSPLLLPRRPFLPTRKIQIPHASAPALPPRVSPRCRRGGACVSLGSWSSAGSVTHAGKVQGRGQTKRDPGTPLFPSRRSWTCHVLLRDDAVRKPPQQPYRGPYEVIERNDKYFTIQLPGRSSTISIDRLKPAYTINMDEHNPHASAPAPPASDVATSRSQSTSRREDKERDVAADLGGEISLVKALVVFSISVRSNMF